MVVRSHPAALAGVAQMAERFIRNEEAVSSTLTPSF
jgi:hypothetical protein